MIVFIMSLMLQMFSNVVLIGDSHLRTITQRDFRTFNGSVSIFCEPGSGIEYVEYIMAELDWREYGDTQPDTIMLLTGGNDLDKSYYVDVKRLVARMVQVADEARLLGAKLIIMEQFPRPGARYGGVNYQTNRLWFEHLLIEALPSNARYWRWDTTLRINAPDFLKPDGVHFRMSRRRKVARYLMTGMIFAVNWRRWQS